MQKVFESEWNSHAISFAPFHLKDARRDIAVVRHFGVCTVVAERDVVLLRELDCLAEELDRSRRRGRIVRIVDEHYLRFLARARGLHRGREGSRSF